MTPDETRNWMADQLAARLASEAKSQSSAAPQTGSVAKSTSTPQKPTQSAPTPRSVLTKEIMQANVVPSTSFEFPWDQFSVAFLIRAVHFYDPEQHATLYRKNKAWAAVASEVQPELRKLGLPSGDAKEFKNLWNELSRERSGPSLVDNWEPHFDKYDPEILRMLDEVIQSSYDRTFGPGRVNFAAKRKQRLAYVAQFALESQQRQAKRDSQQATPSKQITQQSATSKQVAQQSTPPRQVLQPSMAPKQAVQQPTPPRQDTTAATPSPHTRPEASNDSPSGAATQRKRPHEAADETAENSSEDRYAELLRQRDAILRAKEAKLRALEDANVKSDEMIKLKEKQIDVHKQQLGTQQSQQDMLQELLKMTEALQKDVRDLRHDLSQLKGQMTFMASMVPAMISGSGMAGRVPQPVASATPGRGKSPDHEEYCAPTAESSTEAAESPSTSKTPGSPPARRATRASTTSK